MLSRVHALAVPLALACLYAAGCGPSVRAPGDAPPASSPAPASPTVQVPTLSRASEASTAEAARVFVAHYYRLINHAARTGDTRPLRHASATDCGGCDRIADQIGRAYERGGRISGFWWVPYATFAVDEQDYKVVLVDLEADAYDYRRAARATQDRVSATEHHHLVRARRVDGAWRMIYFGDQADLMPDGDETSFPTKAPPRPRFFPLLS